jgi:hypothetical protein
MNEYIVGDEVSVTLNSGNRVKAKIISIDNDELALKFVEYTELVNIDASGGSSGGSGGWPTIHRHINEVISLVSKTRKENPFDRKLEFDL